MGMQETNIYLIKNLKELNCKYKLYRVLNLPKTEDFHKNKQLLINILRNKTQTPIQPLKTKNHFLIAQLCGYKDLPESETLIRTKVKIKNLNKIKELKFDSLTPETIPLAKKFIEWEMQRIFYNDPRFWQPRSGFPFYNKHPDDNFSKKSKYIDLFKGFLSRVISLKENKLGICIDVTGKYVSHYYIPTNLDTNEFNKYYRGKKCIYEYGGK